MRDHEQKAEITTSYLLCSLFPLLSTRERPLTASTPLHRTVLRTRQNSFKHQGTMDNLLTTEL